MDWDKQLRGISIIAAEAGNPEKPRRIAIPAVRAVVADALLLTRSLFGTFSSAGSPVPIRAPVTADEDDDDDGSVTDEHNSDAIDSGSEDDEDDGFEFVSRDGEDENELEGLVMEGLRAHEESVGENGDGSDDDDDDEEEASVNYSSLGEESGVVSEADGDGTKAKVVIPRASLSTDDDEVLGGSGDEESVLMRVTRALGDEEAQVEDMGMVDEPECSGSVLTDVVSSEDEAVEMKVEDESNDFMVQNEASIGLDGSSKQLIEEQVVRRTIIMEDDGGGSIQESDASMEPGDAEGVEDNAVEMGEREMTVLSEGSCTVTGELVCNKEDMVQAKLSDDDALVLFETGTGVAPGDCSEFVVESEGNAVDEDKGLDETFSKIVELEVGQVSINKESDNKTDDVIACEADESVIKGGGSFGSGSRESVDEDTGSLIGEANVLTENACSAVGELEKPECEGELEIGMTSESSQVTPIVDSAMTRNLDVPREIDVVVSGCDSSNQKANQEANDGGKQESEVIDEKLSLPDEDIASILRSSFEMANEGVENGEQIDKQVNFQSDSQPNQISVGIEETTLLSVKDVERAMPEDSCVTEKEMQISRLIHNDTCMELDEYEGTCNTKETLSEESTSHHPEDSSTDHSLQLISGRVKERIEKNKLIKENIQKIYKGIDLCSEEDSSVTEVDSQENLAPEEHHTSLEPDDHVYDETKTKLPEQEELLLGLDFSINVLVIGKTGVGKSATINSIFGETKSPVNAFEVTTKSPNYVVGNVRGILIRILDTPGLLSSATKERYNQKVLMSIKKSMRRFPVDVVLYIDRLDENPDVRLLRAITSSLGSSIWRKAIVVLTHAASDVSDSSQRSSVMHQSIREAVPELRCVERSKMPGIVLVENNKTSESTCPDWRLNLLMLCCSVKIRRSNNTLVEKPDSFGSLALFCSLWNVLLNQGRDASQPLDDLEEKKRRLLESYPEILWDEQSQGCLEEQEKFPVKKQDEQRRRRRRGSFGFQATKRLGIYLDTCDLHTGFSMGNSRKEKQEEGKMLVKMRSSLSVLGAVHVLASVITCVYGQKDV